MGRLLDLFMNKYPYTDFHELNTSWLLETVTELLKEVDSLEEWKKQHEAEYDELKILYDKIVSGNFPPAMYNALHKWVVDNSASIIGDLIKMVFFQITDDGYFIAYIPESWSEILFGTTGLDTFPAGYDFGHLTLSY